MTKGEVLQDIVYKLKYTMDKYVFTVDNEEESIKKEAAVIYNNVKGNVLYEIADNKFNNGEFLRAGGDCICRVCNQEYRNKIHIRLDDICPTLIMLCNGDLIKL